MLSKIRTWFSFSHNQERFTDPVAAERIDLARQRMVDASQRIIDLKPIAGTELNQEISREIAKDVLVVLGGIGDIAVFTDRNEKKALHVLRIGLTSTLPILTGSNMVSAGMRIHQLIWYLGFACSLGGDPTGTETHKALSGGLDAGIDDGLLGISGQ